MEHETIEGILASGIQYRYQMLDRLRADCKYYLGFGGRNKEQLWAHDEKEQLSYMRLIYDSLEEKPEWLSPADIDQLEMLMLPHETEREEHLCL